MLSSRHDTNDFERRVRNAEVGISLSLQHELLRSQALPFPENAVPRRQTLLSLSFLPSPAAAAAARAQQPPEGVLQVGRQEGRDRASPVRGEEVQGSHRRHVRPEALEGSRPVAGSDRAPLCSGVLDPPAGLPQAARRRSGQDGPCPHG